MIKKVVIFAAGRGTRMAHLSKDRPKHLIDVFGKPFLYYLLTNLKSVGFQEVIIVTGYLSYQFDDFFTTYKEEFPIFCTVNQFAVMGEEKYGTLIPLQSVHSVVNNEPFVVVMGDNLYALDDLRAFAAINDDYQYIGGLKVDNPSEYGTLVTDEEDWLKRIDEKVSSPVSNIINAGIYKFTSDIYSVTDKVKPAKNGEYQITEAVSMLALEKKVKIKKIQQYWLDFGRPEDIKKIEKFIVTNDLFKTYGINQS
jgi:bifunctional UDP-N-acetylglucosamine pyrophosphorylase/glucosamine-1-phosphate N-acetyltransferase